MELEIKDRWLRHVRDFPRPGIGLVIEDLIGKTPHPEICRSRDTGVPSLCEIFSRDPREILARGCAAGMARDGLIHHLQPDHRGFCGFIERNLDQGRVAVVTQGAQELIVLGVSQNSIGKTVYASGPDEFNVDGEGFFVGKILYLCERPGKAMVVFSLRKKMEIIGDNVKFF